MILFIMAATWHKKNKNIMEQTFLSEASDKETNHHFLHENEGNFIVQFGTIQSIYDSYLPATEDIQFLLYVSFNSAQRTATPLIVTVAPLPGLLIGDAS